jgi:transcriptional regulator with XRE-family HTH domain
MTLRVKMEESTKTTTTMIPLTAVSRFKWDSTHGKALEFQRGSISRQDFAKAVAEKLELPDGKLSGRLKADSCSARYIQKLEKAEMVSIPIEIARAISKVLGIEVEELLHISSAQIEVR